MIDPEHAAADAAPGPSSTRGTLRRLLPLVRPYRISTIASLCLVVPEGVLALLIPYYLGQVINTAMVGSSTAALDHEALMLLGVLVLQSLLLFAREYIMNTVGERVVADLRGALHAHVMRLPLAFFHRTRTGEILSSAASDVTSLQKTLADAPGQLVRLPITVVGGLILMFTTSPRLTIVMLIAIPPLVIAATLFGNLVNRWSRRAQDELAISAGTFQESTGGIETVKAFSAEAHKTARYRALVDRSFRAFRKKAWIESWFGAIATFAIFSALIGLFWYGGRLAIAGQLTVGQLLAMLGYTLYIQGALGGLTQLWTQVQSTLGSVERVFDLLDEPAESHGPTRERIEAGGKGAPDASEIAFEDVSLRYPGAECDALAGVSFRVRRGEVCALAGASGSGKSSIARLLFRFFDPTAGRALLGGVDLSAIALGELRSSLALVAQDPVLFSGTIRDNIRYGRRQASQEEVEEAARQAQIHDFIVAQPAGYDSLVSERGVTLSGGQRQRIAIARAVVTNPRILVLDEATSALDGESERLVQKALAEVKRGRTTIVIAHRLSTIRDADHIVVLDHGRVVEEGRHDELLKTGGSFARLASLQSEPPASPGPP